MDAISAEFDGIIIVVYVFETSTSQCNRSIIVAPFQSFIISHSGIPSSARTGAGSGARGARSVRGTGLGGRCRGRSRGPGPEGEAGGGGRGEGGGGGARARRPDLRTRLPRRGRPQGEDAASDGERLFDYCRFYYDLIRVLPRD